MAKKKGPTVWDPVDYDTIVHNVNDGIDCRKLDLAEKMMYEARALTQLAHNWKNDPENEGNDWWAYADDLRGISSNLTRVADEIAPDDE